MTEVRERLDGLGLAEYADAFLSEGFDTWSVVEEITESDLTDLGVKLGHRRKLQRAIADSRQHTTEEASPQHSERSGNYEANGTPSGPGHDQSGSGRQKRKYKRHPKADINAPERPASAYVLFSNDMRDMLKERELSFTEMAKVVGERWQALPSAERDSYESVAANAKAQYNDAMADYKKTDSYARYQQYLADFKARYTSKQSRSASKRSSPSLDAPAAPSSDVPKRLKLETETSTETLSSTEDAGGRQRRPSASQPYAPAVNLHPNPYSKSSSPGGLPYHSPPSSDAYGVKASPTTSHSRLSYFDPVSYPATAPYTRYTPQASDPDLAERRMPPLLHQSSAASSGSLPPLSKEISSHSSDSSRSPASTPFQAMMKDGMPPSARVLPPIHAATGVAAKSMEFRPFATPAPSASPPDDPRHSAPLAALLRAAGELANEDRIQYSTMSTRPPGP